MIAKSNDLLGLHIPRWEEFPPFELYVDQVLAFVTDKLGDFSQGDEMLVTQAMINNYVKQGLLPAPIKKKYNRDHLAKLVVICISKRMIPLSYISESLSLMTRFFEVDEGYNVFCDEVEYEIKSRVDPTGFPPRTIDESPSSRVKTMRALASAVASILIFDRLVEQRRRLSNLTGKMINK